MSRIRTPGRQSLLKINRYSVRPQAAAFSMDPSIPLRGRPPKRVKQEYMSAAIRHQRVSSFIMKLFDRSVDLARFGADSPLYPVCRAWMRNQPRLRVQVPLNEKPDEPEQRDELPNIIARYNRGKIDQIEKMPKPAQSELKPFHFERRFQDGDKTKTEGSAARQDLLLKFHKSHWNSIRRRWQCHRQNYLRKYQNSYDLLDAIVMKHRRS